MGSFRKGLGLTEVVISIFLLLAGVIVVVQLFHTALRNRRLVERNAYDGVSLTHPDFPSLTADVRVELDRALYSSCRELEALGICERQC